MLYTKNNNKQLDIKLFEKPTSEYRGTPFWAWNCKLCENELKEQIENFKIMGMGGFHMHVRTGMASPYMNSEFMNYIGMCIEEAKQKDMLAWLYDEDRWPSGTAGGKVTQDNPDFAMKNLMFTTVPYSKDFVSSVDSVGGRGGRREENGVLLAVYDVVLNADGTLAEYWVIDENSTPKGIKWYAYLECAVADPWFNNSPYVDTLNPKAIEKFIEETHEKYYKRFGCDFGKTVPAIFTDEPQFSPKWTLDFASQKKDVFITWTNGLEKDFKAFCGLDIIKHLPELFWESPDGKPSLIRYKYHDFITEKFVSSFCDTIGKWCDSRGIYFGGHLMSEESLFSQTLQIGEAMRGYRAFKKMPGIDNLCNHREYNTAKQCASVMHQMGGEAMLSELYGVTGWDFDFRGHKLQGDWQAALGVTVRVPHLTWMSMKGEAKRDYPACIGYQSPWWKKYSIIEDHFARLNTALTRGKPDIKVAVIHPIESYWLAWGPSDMTADKRDMLESNHQLLTDTLLLGMIDFDFISESLLPSQCNKGTYPLKVGEMEYDAVIVPACHTLRSTTLERLEEFKACGGDLIFLGNAPKYEDAVESDRPQRLYDISRKVAFNSTAVLNALKKYRFIDARVTETRGGVAFNMMSGSRTNDLIYQLRRDTDCMWLFIAKGADPITPDVDATRTIKISLNGTFVLEEYNTLTGKVNKLPAAYSDGKTTFEKVWYMHDSLLLKLTEGKFEGESLLKLPAESGRMIHEKVKVVLDEPNALLLDMAEYAFDGGELQKSEEFLKLENEGRRKLGIPIRQKHITQPYKITPKKPEHEIYLRMKFESEIHCEGVKLAIEEPENSKIVFNGNQIESKADGWYVDKALETVPLTPILKGENILEVTVPIGERTNLEWFYLLGDFGVRVDGSIKTVIKKVEQLAFGDFTHQGLPFYTGNVTYETEVTVGDDGKFSVRAEQYRGALIDVLIDGKVCGNIIFSPYTFETKLPAGKHILGLKLYGTRQNGFAQLHHTQGLYFYQSPNSWREYGSLWQYEYQFKKAGILRSPIIIE